MNKLHILPALMCLAITLVLGTNPSQADVKAELVQLDTLLKSDDASVWFKSLYALRKQSKTLFPSQDGSKNQELKLEQLTPIQKQWVDSYVAFLKRQDLNPIIADEVAQRLSRERGPMRRHFQKALSVQRQAHEQNPDAKSPIRFPGVELKYTALSTLINDKKMPPRVRNHIFTETIKHISPEETKLRGYAIYGIAKLIGTYPELQSLEPMVLQWLGDPVWKAEESYAYLKKAFPDSNPINLAILSRINAKPDSARSRDEKALLVSTPPVDKFNKQKLINELTAAILNPATNMAPQHSEDTLKFWRVLKNKDAFKQTLSKEQQTKLEDGLASLSAAKFDMALWTILLCGEEAPEAWLRKHAYTIIARVVDTKRMGYLIEGYPSERLHDLLLLALLENLTLTPESIKKLKTFVLYNPTQESMDTFANKSLSPKAGKVFINRIAALSILLRHVEEPKDILYNSNLGFYARYPEYKKTKTEAFGYDVLFSHGKMAQPEKTIPENIKNKAKFPRQIIKMISSYPESAFAKQEIPKMMTQKDKAYSLLEFVWATTSDLKLKSTIFSSEQLNTISLSKYHDDGYLAMVADFYIHNLGNPKKAVELLAPRFKTRLAKDQSLDKEFWHRSMDSLIDAEPNHPLLDNIATRADSISDKNHAAFFKWVLSARRGKTSDFPAEAFYALLVEGKHVSEIMLSLTRLKNNEPLKSLRKIDLLLQHPYVAIDESRPSAHKVNLLGAYLGLMDRVWWEEHVSTDPMPHSNIVVPRGYEPLF